MKILCDKRQLKTQGKPGANQLKHTCDYKKKSCIEKQTQKYHRRKSCVWFCRGKGEQKLCGVAHGTTNSCFPAQHTGVVLCC